MVRTAVVKNWDEAYAYLLAQHSSGVETDGRYKTLFVTSAGNGTTEAGDETQGGGDDVYVVPKTPILVQTVLNMGSTGEDATFTANTPPGQGQLVPMTGALNPTVTSGGLAGYAFDIMTVYDFSSATAELYLQNKSGGTPETSRAIRDKGYLKHRKRNANVERTLSVQQLFVNFGAGLLKWPEIPFCMKISRKDDRAGLATEDIYYYQCYMHKPEPNESGGDTDTDVTFDIMYERSFTIAPA